VNAFVAAGAGFLLAVLWFDLMFDVQARGHGSGELPKPVLDSIGGYYERVTTGARPMNRLIATVMLATLAAIVVEIVNGKPSSWIAYASLALAAFAIVLAGARTVPSARRLGGGRDSVPDQSALARAILRQHVLCFASIIAVLTLQLASS
jgi:ER membrane protein SH3